ncbi:MAG: metallophosphoesterase [Bacteroidota bacterium]|nr:metallophosphoesterase [Bacteroidota bacterium]MDE2646479.1 metallophosphoesterase [Bacteroidota bacterium]MXZ16980.1 hypothetical protein [Rhodothermaceae bacterium]MYG68446.1 hypothetical protein [Rhodothermaceae bacterium]MYJ45004.1 hypothetical protein [Rhodothermaceae bacterium]
MPEFSITAISDTHGQVALPDLLKDYESDILIHCGDFTAGRTNHLYKSVIYDSHTRSWRKFLRELAVVRDQFRAIIVVPGNHDQICEFMPMKCQLQTEEVGVHLLMNDGVTLFGSKEDGGVRIWGLPHTPPFGPWFFQGYDMFAYTNKIPVVTDVLISHGPPYSILDTVGPVLPQDIHPTDYLGSKELYVRCQELPKLKAVFFGHIHSSRGEDQKHGIDYFNCSVLDEEYQWKFNPVTTIIKIDERS